MKHPYSLLMTIFVCVALLLNSSALASEYQLQSGDKISVHIFEENSIEEKYTIQENGTVTLPLLGEVILQSLSIKEAKNKIITLLSDGYFVDPIVKIEILSYDPIYVLGEVTNPGEYAFKQNLSALQAIALAGGYTYRANKKHLKIIQNKQTNKITSSHILEPGDTLIVKERFF